MKFSVVIPAHNEEGSIEGTLAAIDDRLHAEGLEYEIVVVDDHSVDRTEDAVSRSSASRPAVVYCANTYPNGFGFAVRKGLEVFTGDAVAIVMADLSDSPDDLVRYFRLLEAGYDCAFGSRFVTGAVVEGYPYPKLLINRIVNLGIRILFGHGYNDTTNAFKAYRREVIANVQPLLSSHFNLTVELPLKAIVRGHSYAVVPIAWRDRTAGESKLRLKEQGSRYLFIALYVFLEHHLSRGDYRIGAHPAGRWRRWRTGAPGMTSPRRPITVETREEAVSGHGRGPAASD